MAFARRLIPAHFLPSDWDDAWARGWFRMRQSLFTTHFLEFERHFHSAVWLRVGLGNFQPDRRFQALKKANRRFRVEFHPLGSDGPTQDREALYARYRGSLSFDPAPTLGDLLLGDAAASFFPTWEVALFDGDALVAGGVFDVGDRASAGISCYYDPEYRKYSLGKYLIYLKMEFCAAQGHQWFYPGYAAPGQPRFDYKWAIGTSTLQYLDLGTGGWTAYDPQGPVPDPLGDMTDRLAALLPLWDGREPAPRLTRYLHLDINLNPQLKGMDLFDYPVFLDCFPDPSSPPPLVIVYDPRDGLYSLLHCRSVFRFEDPGKGGDIFESDLLMVHRTLFSTADPAEMASALMGFVLSPRG